MPHVVQNQEAGCTVPEERLWACRRATDGAFQEVPLRPSLTIGAATSVRVDVSLRVDADVVVAGTVERSEDSKIGTVQNPDLPAAAHVEEPLLRIRRKSGA